MAGPERPLSGAAPEDAIGATPPVPGPPIGRATFRFDHVDSFAAAIGDAHVVCVPVNPGSFRAEPTQIQLGRDSPHLSRGVAGDGRIGVPVSRHGPAGTILDGRAIGPRDQAEAMHALHEFGEAMRDAVARLRHAAARNRLGGPEWDDEDALPDRAFHPIGEVIAGLFRR